jgi:PAS domain S-box-containing protein
MRQERKNSINALADDIDTESRLRLIINTAPTLIYSARPDGYIDFFNQQCLEFLGLPFEEISGWRWTKLVHPDDRGELLAKWRAALETGEPVTAESRVRRADGNYRWMLHRNVAIVDDQRNIVRWFGSSIDIDDQKRAEVALRQTTDELRRSEFYLAEGQRLAHIGSWSFTVEGMREYWSAEWFDILGLDPARGVPRLCSPESWMMYRLPCRPTAGHRLKPYLRPI